MSQSENIYSIIFYEKSWLQSNHLPTKLNHSILIFFRVPRWTSFLKIVDSKNWETEVDIAIKALVWTGCMFVNKSRNKIWSPTNDEGLKERFMTLNLCRYIIVTIFTVICLSSVTKSAMEISQIHYFDIGEAACPLDKDT